jgi:ketosteroid isomerase-like protein
MSARTTLLAVLVLAVASTACQPPAQEAAGLSDEDVAAIRQLHDGLFEAVVAGDWSVLAAYAEDGVAMPPNHPAVEGRAAIEAWNRALPLEFVDGGGTPDVIDGRDGLAYVRGSFWYDMRPEGQPELVRYEGKLIWVLRKQPDGTWLLEAAIWNSDLPLPEGVM